MTSEERSFDQRAVEWCMKAAGQKVRAVPEIATEDERKLRAKLILEESLETIKALGFDAQLTWQAVSSGGQTTRVWQQVLIGDVVFVEHDREPDIEGVADGCADIMVVTLGTLSAFGIDADKVLEEVHRANKDKFPDGKAILRDDGKYLKPKNWWPPDIALILKKQGWNG